MPTKIEWATEAWNPVTGCTKVSEGCRNCYAERMANRLRGRYGYDQDRPFMVRVRFERLSQPSRWRKPRLIFVCSMGDLFHKDVPDDFFEWIFKEMAELQRHTFLILTKRPARARQIIRNHMDNAGEEVSWPLPNVWLGVSVEDQKTAGERIPVLLDTPAVHRFVSVEPMLGPVDLCNGTCSRGYYNWLEGYGTKVEHASDCDGTCRNCPVPVWVETPNIEWVICGGESGPGARPMHPEWPRSLRAQCAEAGVPFFFKQWGEWAPLSLPSDVRPPEVPTPAGRELVYPDGVLMRRVGKHNSGALLDGEVVQEWPQELMRKREVKEEES